MVDGADMTGQWTRGESDKAAVAAGCYFDLPAAERVRDFFAQFLRHSKGQWAGKPFTLLDWQWRDVIGPLFGWKRADGTRRYRSAYIEIPKKSGKSTLCAGLGIYLMCGDGEPGAEVYCAAADRIQASIIHGEADRMVQASPALSSRCMATPSAKTLAFPQTNSMFRAISSDSYRNEGLNIHGLLFDELHAQPNRELWDTLRYGGAARTQPLTIAITTAGYDRHSICYEQREYALNVRDGVVDDWAFLPVIFAADPLDDWTAPATWAKANPSLGATVFEPELASACKEAQESPAQENAFKRYRLNLWTEQDIRWLQLDKWDACGEAFDPAMLEGQECYLGLDMSSTTDLTAAVAFFPESGSVLAWFWCPAEGARLRERRDRVPYSTWQRQGHITMTEGNVVDYDAVRAYLKTLGERFHIREIAIDRWNSTQLQTQLMGDGFEVVPFGQGFASMSAPTKALEGRVLSGKLAHGGHPILRWNAMNVTVETDAAGNMKPSKAKSTERIDGIVALVMAIGRANAQGGVGASVYETRGLILV